MRTYTTLFAVALIALAGTVQDALGQAVEEDLPTVAVLDFTGFMLGEAGNSVNLGKAVSAMLVTEFSGREASTSREGWLVVLENMKSPITSTASSIPASYT